MTLSGIVIFVRLLQPANTELPMFVTLFGIEILVRLLQSENAEALKNQSPPLIPVTGKSLYISGMITSVLVPEYLLTL